MTSSTLAGLSLRDLEYAVTVGRLRHFGRAAERCGVSQPGLSEQIRKLEGVLGTALFERGPQGVTPTPRGEALLARAEALVAAARELLEAGRAAARPLSGPLRLGVIATLGPYYMPLLLPRLRARFPDLDLRLEEGRTAGLVDRLRAGELDAVLLALPAPGDGLAAERLFFEPFRLLAPTGHPLAAQKRIGLEDLAGGDLLLLEDGHCLRDQALSLCRGVAGGSHAARFAASLEMLRHMIAAGEGYSLLPLLATSGREDLSALVACCPIDDAEAGRTVGLAWRQTNPRDAEFRELAQFLKDALPDELK
jgi:LysR family hydrogen peroxide-inducible transcriptional activator